MTGGVVNAREEVLARLGAALSDLPAEARDVAVPRDYRHSRPAGTDLLVERLADYGAKVRRTTRAGLPAAIATALSEHGAGRTVVPDDLRTDWVSEVSGEVVRDSGQLSYADLDAVDGVLTGCAVAIAETGTIVLDGRGGQGRRVVTLLPDYHLCVVLADQVVGSVPEGLGRLDGTRPLTFISGPSATSDIELNRVEGVHGPRTLEVILVE